MFHEHELIFGPFLKIFAINLLHIAKKLKYEVRFNLFGVSLLIGGTGGQL